MISLDLDFNTMICFRKSFIVVYAFDMFELQWKNLGPDEATCEIEGSIQEAYPFLFSFMNIEDGVILRGSRI